MKPLISIIVPIYKVEDYLERCVKSLLMQTYENIEILLVDDGSPDRCPQMCDAFQKEDNRIRVIHKKNGGLSDARNYGYKASTGDYICFVDSDDFVSKYYIESLFEVIKRWNCDVSICGFKTVTGLDKEFDDEPSVTDNVMCCTGIQMMSHMYDNLFLDTVVAWNKMYKRCVLEGEEYPVGLIHEDEATTCKYLYKAARVGYIENELYYYYVRPNSIMTSEINSKKLDAKTKALCGRIEFLKEKGLAQYESLDTLRLLKHISKSCFITRDKDKEFSRQSMELLKKTYRSANKSAWNRKNSILMKITYVIPWFYGMLKSKGH